MIANNRWTFIYPIFPKTLFSVLPADHRGSCRASDTQPWYYAELWVNPAMKHLQRKITELLNGRVNDDEEGSQLDLLIQDGVINA